MWCSGDPMFGYKFKFLKTTQTLTLFYSDLFCIRWQKYVILGMSLYQKMFIFTVSYPRWFPEKKTVEILYPSQI